MRISFSISGPHVLELLYLRNIDSLKGIETFDLIRCFHRPCISFLFEHQTSSLFIALFFSRMQVEGPKTAEEMLVILQRVLEESSPVLVSARLDAEERRNNMRLREEQDAAYRAALEADQVCYVLTLLSCRSEFHNLLVLPTVFLTGVFTLSCQVLC